MARVSIESSLMEQMVAGKPITPTGTDFAVAQDLEGTPVIFFVGTDGQLVIASRANGNVRAVGISKKVGVTDKVDAIAISQAQSDDRTIFLAFTSVGGDGRRSLRVLEPFAPSFDWTSPEAAGKLIAGDSVDLNIEKIWLTPYIGCTAAEFEGYFPSFYVSYSAPNGVTDDVCPIVVQRGENAEPPKWHMKDSIRKAGDFTLSTNSKDVLAIQAGNIGFNGTLAGLFVLSREVGQARPMLRFIGYDTRNPENPALRVIPQTCPPSASCFATYADAEGKTALLVGGEGLSYFSADTLISGTRRKPKMIRTDAAYNSLHQMLVAQSKPVDEADAAQLSLWFLNGDKELRYDQFKLTNADPEAENSKPEPVPQLEETVPLLAFEDTKAKFCATYAAGKAQRLFTLSSSGQMQMLVQDDITRHWKAQPLSVPALRDLVKFNSYTTVIQLETENEVPLSKHKIHFASTTSNEFTINGELYEVGSGGVTVQTDDMGRITVILPIDDLGAPTYTITQAGDTVFANSTTRKIDPMGPVNRRLDTIQSSEDLKKLKDKDGNPLIKGNVSDEELQKAANAIKDLRNVAKDMSDGKPNPPPPPPPPAVARRRPWDFWKWAQDALSTVGDLVVKGATFLIKLAKQAWQFVLDTVTAIGKALTKVFEAIGATLMSVLEAIGDFFGWGDIKDMQRILGNFANTGIYWAWSKIDDFNDKVNTEMEKMRAVAHMLTTQKLPDALENVKLRPGTAGKAAGGIASDALAVLTSPKARWVVYQLEHAGKAVMGAVGGAIDDPGGVFANLISNFQRLLADITKLVTDLWKTVSSALQEKEISLGDLMRKIASQSIDGLIDIVKSILNLLIRFLADVVARVAIELNKKREIPVLSAMWKALTGTDLSVLDVAMLAVAVPITLILKLITGKKPKDLHGIGEMLEAGAAWKSLEAAWQTGKKDSAPSLPPSLSSDGKIPKLQTPAFPKGAIDALGKDKWKDPLKFKEKWLYTIKPILPLAVPCVLLLNFNLVTVPGWAAKDEKPGGFGFKPCLKFVFKAVGALCSIPWHENEEEETRRMIVHCIGAIRPGLAFVGSSAENLITVATSNLQLWGLVWIQVQSLRAKGSYDPEQAASEWLGLLSVATAGIAPIANEPISIVVATLINNASTGLKLIRNSQNFDKAAFDEGYPKSKSDFGGMVFGV